MSGVARSRETGQSISRETLPLTQGQLSIWLAQMLDPAAPCYNIGEFIDIEGPVDPALFDRAIRLVVEASDALHLRVIEAQAGPVQHFEHDPDWVLTNLDFSREADPVQAAREWMRRDMARPFQLDRDALYRFALLRISPTRTFWYCANHHIINDGIGGRMLIERIAATYSALADNLPPPPGPDLSWRDVIADEAAYRSTAQFERDRAYWLEQLADLPPPSTLSGHEPKRPTAFMKETCYIPRSVDLQALARRSGGVPAASIVVAIAIYLHRLTDEEDIVLGMPVTGRVGAKSRSIVGLAMNTAPLRVSMKPSATIASTISDVARRIRSMMRHTRYRIENMRRDQRLAPSDPDFCGTYVNYLPTNDDLAFAGRRVSSENVGNWRVEDLHILYLGGDDPAGQRVDFIANPQHYTEHELGKHARRFVHILGQIAAADADTTVDSIDIGPGDPETVLMTSSRRRARQATARPALEVAAGMPAAAPPGTPTEIKLAEIWSEILRQPVLDRRADFFALGGDSLRAIQVMTRVRRQYSIELPLSIAFDARTLEDVAERIDSEVCEAGHGGPLPALTAAPAVTTAPLSFSQQRMWTIQTLDPSNTAYNIATALRLNGEVDHQAMARSIDALLSRHDILRTTYHHVDSDIAQRVAPFTAGTLEILDLSDRKGDPEQAALAVATAMARTPIDLQTGPIFSSKLLRIGPEDHLLSFVVHHIAGDQWSSGVIGRELASLYNALRGGRAIEAPAASLSYRDFAIWEREHLGGKEIEGQLGYWRKKLDGVPPLDLPTDKPRPRVPSLSGNLSKHRLPEDLFLKLEAFARREQATLFMTMFAGFAALLSRLSDQRDIAVGVPVANRSHDAVEQMVGTFVNFVVLRVDLSGDPTFSELVARVRQTALEAFTNQDVPFDRLVQEIVRSRDTSRAPLAQVMFNGLSAPMHGIAFDGLSWEWVELDRAGAQFELNVTVDRQLSHSISVEYNNDLFERATIDRLAARYATILSQVVAAPQTRLSELDLLGEDERRLVLETWNATATEHPQTPFISMFEGRAAAHPDVPAVTFEDVTLSYRDLDVRANALAHELARAGATRGVKVGVCLERSLAMLIALLAVQKAGGAYVPLDPELPAARLAYMISDSGIGVIIMSARTRSMMEVPDHVVSINAEPFACVGAPVAATSPDRAIEASDPVYVIYTSGSTGRPKGVVIPHGALSNFLTSMQREPGLSDDDVLSAVTTVSFDIAGLELYLPLTVGARIELVAQATASDGVALARLIDERKVSVLQATPATWRMLIDAGWGGSPRLRALCGGEALPRELAEPLLDRVAELWNLYGPTETTIWSTVGRVGRNDTTISIGRPIDNTQIYILNGLTPAPVGGIGEICIGGSGVAIGYLGRDDLTAERFVADPFSSHPGARMYRTGDLGRWSPDGRLHHLGRIDHQVKIRGFRIEIGEIEALLNELPSVRQAVVVTREIGPGDLRLVAYILYHAGEELTISDVRRYLRASLPDYMIPAMAVPIDAVPLSASGKVDRNALPNPFDHAVRPANAFEPPSPGAETVVAGVWRRLLKVEKIGAEDNFFELGGDSLLALRFVAAMQKETGTRIEPRNLFFQNLRQVAAAFSPLPVKGEGEAR